MRFALLSFWFLTASGSIASAQPVITTIAGANWIFPDGRSSLQAPLGRVNSVAVDTKGNTYFSDATANMVMRLTPQGVVQIVAGNGFKAYSGDGGLAVNASLAFPRGVAVDQDGNVYILDGDNFRIRKVDTSGIIRTIAGTGKNGTNGDNVPATQADMGQPTLIAVDKNQNVYFLDGLSQRVRRVSSNGIITFFAGSGNCNQTISVGCDAGRPTFTDGVAANNYCFRDVEGLAVDSSGNVFIADSGARVVVTVSQGALKRVAGGGAAGRFADGIDALTADLAGLSGLAVDSQGVLYLSESGNTRVRKVVSGVISTLAGSTTSGFRDATGANAQFRAPIGLAVDSSWNVYVADQENFRIRAISLRGDVTTIAGSGRYSDYPDDGSPLLTSLSLPYGVGVDGGQNIYIGDSLNSLVRVLRQGRITNFAGTGYSDDATSNSVPATSVGIGQPGNVVFDSAGNAYFPDLGNHVVRMIAPNGNMTTVAGVPGVCGLGREGVQATSTPLNLPAAVALDSANNLYISEYSNSRVRKVTPAGIVTTFAGFSPNPFRTSSGDNGPATQAGIGLPFGLAVDSFGAVFIADQQYGFIRRVGTNGVITTVAGQGTLSPLTSPVQATLAKLRAPTGLAIDSNNNLYIADSLLHAVFQLSGGMLKAYAGTGTPGFSGDGGLATQALLSGPVSVAVDKANNVYVADTSNNRVRAIQTIAPTFSADPSQLTFSAKKDSALPVDQSIALRSNTLGLPYRAQSDQKWLQVTPASGVVPISVTVTADPTGLAAGVQQGVITLSAPGAQPSSIRISVTLTIAPADQPPAIDVDVSTKIFQFKTGDGPASGTISVGNKGSGTLTYTSTAAVDLDNGSWLKLDASATGSATPATPGAISFTVDPGGLDPDTYAGKITITPTGLPSVSIPVVITVADGAPRILLSQNAINFVAVQGGGAPLPQRFVVINDGAGTLSYNVDFETLKGGDDWFDVVGDGDDVDPGQLFLSQVAVSVDPTDLDPGVYTARVRISDPNAINSPQTVSVYLTVLTPSENPGPDIAPGGVVFQAEAGARPGSQTIAIANLRKDILGYRVVSDVLPAQNWLAVAPDTGSVPGRATESRLKLQPDFSAVPAGSYRAQVVVSFTDRTTRSIDVLSVVNPPPGAKDDSRLAGACTPVVSVTEPVNNGTVLRGSTITLKAKLTTVCSPQDKILFSVNGQQPGTYMNGAGSDFSYAYNVPQAGTQLQIKFTPFSLQLVVPVTVALTITDPVIKITPAPVVKDVANTVTSESRSLIAPGSLVTISGDNLADAPLSADPQSPQMQLGGTSVEVAGVNVPITSVAPDKITAIVPFRLKRDSKQEIRVRRTDQESVSVNLVVARTQPGVLTVNGTGSGQGKIYKLAGTNRVLADASSPATAGDTIVILCAGLGDVASSTLPAGALPTADDDPTVRSGVVVTIGGRAVTPTRQALSTTDVGQYEVEVAVPAGVAPGNAIVKLVSARQPSPSTVTMAIQ